jgi:orotidine-5'-phosphate decarboxylase
MKRNPVIVALDVESAAQARALVARIGDRVGFYKVGMELYAAAGMEMVKALRGEGKDVFLDLKFYDIPETVKRATARVAECGARFLTVHGSQSILRAAVEGKAGSELSVLAVTVLTSFDESDLDDLGYAGTVADLVSRRAAKAVAAGVEGLVCSALEVSAVRKLTGPKAILVTPGVRSQDADAGDQKRVATPARAVRDGADFLVIGRQITRAADPAGEAERILAEISCSDCRLA